MQGRVMMTKHSHEGRVIVTDGSCPRCNQVSVAVDKVLNKHTQVDTGNGFTFDPPLGIQELVEAVQENRKKK
jgi:hypothetical protein